MYLGTHLVPGFERIALIGALKKAGSYLIPSCGISFAHPRHLYPKKVIMRNWTDYRVVCMI